MIYSIIGMTKAKGGNLMEEDPYTNVMLTVTFGLHYILGPYYFVGIGFLFGSLSSTVALLLTHRVFWLEIRAMKAMVERHRRFLYLEMDGHVRRFKEVLDGLRKAEDDWQHWDSGGHYEETEERTRKPGI